MPPGHPPTGWGHAVGALASSAGFAGAGMLGGHLPAAVVLGWFLRQGERVLWTAACRIVQAAARVRALLVRRFAPAAAAWPRRAGGCRYGPRPGSWP